MEKVYQAVLILHILSGTISLFCGTCIISLQKGGKAHRTLGKIFFTGMAGVFATSLYMSLAKANWFLLCVGFFSFYLSASGYRMLHFKTVMAWKQPIAPVDHILGIGGLAACAGLWILAGILYVKGEMFAVVPAVFGTISGYLAYQGYRNFTHPPAGKKYWIRSHAIRMTGAFTAAVTAFLVVNVQLEPNWVLWLLPTALITPLGLFQLKAFLNKKAGIGKKMAVAVATLICFQPINAQTTHVAISVEGFGAGLGAIVTTKVSADSFSMSQRILPGMQKPLLFTENGFRKGNVVEGKMVLLGSMIYRFAGYWSQDSMMIALYRAGDQPVGKIVSSPGLPPMASIAIAAKEITDTFAAYLYNHSELETPAFKAFAEKLRFYGSFLQDEWELFAAVNRDMRSLPFSHTRLTKMPEKDFRNMINSQYSSPDTDADLSYPAPATALITIRKFNGRGNNLSDFMREIISKEISHLIIDLRGNTGGGAGAALQLVKHLSPVFETAGALVTNKWFDTTSRIPVPADYGRFYTFSQGPTTVLIDALSKNAGVILSVTPALEQFKGKVYVLTNKVTASACEPTVYALQKRGRAAVIGENTAGAMLSSGAYRLSTGFALTLPVADYYTFDGTRIEGLGVKPDVPVRSEKALERVLKIIGEQPE